MTKIFRDNCIYFGDDIAEIYDFTRPFMPSHRRSEVLNEVCKYLTNKFSNNDRINILEVGSGTGRLTLALAKHYEEFISNLGKDKPYLHITCIDRSSEMLRKLTDKIKSSSDNFKHVIIPIPTPKDIRDIQIQTEKFHAVIAHWVFHVMSDWRISVFAIEKVLREDGLIFFFREESALYNAIDGDIRNLETDVETLWKQYHEKRRAIASRLAHGGPIIPPRFRLGSNVIDDRIENLFAALGWSMCQNFEKMDKWMCSFTLENIINKVIRYRAFTNMRLFPDEDASRLEFQNLADELIDQYKFKKPMLNYKWEFQVSFSGKVLSIDSNNRFSEKASSVLLHVAKETLGRRWRRRLDNTYERDALWRRLFGWTWIRLHNFNAKMEPLSGTELQNKENILFVYANAPFIEEGISNICTRTSTYGEIFSNTNVCWFELAGRVETHEPFVILFESRLGGESGSDSNKPQNLKKTDNLILRTHIHKLIINDIVEAQLKKLPTPFDGLGVNEPLSLAKQTALRIRHEEPLRSLIEKARSLGVLPFQDEIAEANFIVGIAKLFSVRELSSAYVFPFRADFNETDSHSIGLLVGAHLPVNSGLVEFLLALTDVIFNEYLEDILYEPHSIPNSDAKENVAKINIHQRRPMETWKNVEAPGVLLVVATQVEFDTVVEMAGLDNLENWKRVGKDNCIYYDLGFSTLPVWMTHCEPGSSGPGGSTATLISSLMSFEEKPFAVVMTGIALGLQPKNQKIGDVLISKQIEMYEFQKLNPKKITTYRGDKPHCSTLLLQYFCECISEWGQNTPETSRPKVIPGLILSGEKLINDPDFIEKLKDHQPEAIGGEMEAVGVYSASEKCNTEWIVVKAISDWGIAKSDENQKVAAMNAIDFVFYSLERNSFQKIWQNSKKRKP